MQELLRCQNITKEFPGVKALSEVNFGLNQGEVLAICGENGAGKSTLIKILGGVYRKTSGQLFWENERVDINSPLDSQKLGIGVVHQDFPLASDLTVMENIFLGRLPLKLGGLVDWLKLENNTNFLLSQYGIKLDAKRVISELSVADRQLVAIIKAVSFDTKLVILDEPTSSLSQSEIDILFQIVRKLKKKGISVIYISHRLEELMEIADRFAILRDGVLVAELLREEATLSKIIKSMVGREIVEIGVDRSNKLEASPVIFKVENLCVSPIVKNVSFELRKGEILGIGGLVGAGRTEVLAGIMGYIRSSGNVYLNGKKLKIKSPKDAIEEGFGYVPEDRRKEGLFHGQSVRENISVASIPIVFKRGLLNKKTEIAETENMVEKYNIRTPSIEQNIDFLSGGNQQKTILGRWTMKQSQILLLDEPTNGVDVGAKEEIYQHMYDLTDQGLSIVMVSSDLRELLRMSDRVLIMYAGEIVGQMSMAEADQAYFLEKASGL